ncbi:hypothetical protein ALC57_16603 [Trachymyrmex cornetzi]|uniref:Uncharacterized protein n=1 Tax=Trachymyrmex cornetzi TaxID=471704 RepID=A0A151IUW9_9HYME|nr:hypothetical protein ALC57_16603 [Trachymyrmex cornetzi]
MTFASLRMVALASTIATMAAMRHPIQMKPADSENRNDLRTRVHKLLQNGMVTISMVQWAKNFGPFRRKRDGHKPAPSVFNKHSAKAAVSLERRRGEEERRICLPFPSPPQLVAFLHRISPAKGKGLKFSFDFRGKSDPSLATAGIRSLGAAKLIKSLTADEFAVVWTDIFSALLTLSALPRGTDQPLGKP